MSTFMDVKQKCSVCGKKSAQNIITSTNSFGSPDLDLRPPEMKRSTMPLWIHECPTCGYVAEDLSDRTAASEPWLAREPYVTCDGIPFASELAKRFYRRYLIAVLDTDTDAAYAAARNAAWASDDVGDEKSATLCRNLAAKELARLIEERPKRCELRVCLCDILRRAGRFDEAIAVAREAKTSEEILKKILAFEIARAEEHSTACYTVADADD